jgi:hypothetical protein
MLGTNMEINRPAFVNAPQSADTARPGNAGPGASGGIIARGLLPAAVALTRVSVAAAVPGWHTVSRA